jgi:hypothetical protein
MDIKDRIAALEFELAELKKAAGKTPPIVPPQVKPVDDRPLVTVLHPAAIELPTAEQCRKLIEVISRIHPVLKPRFSMRWHDEEEQELHAGFTTSVRFISTLGRTSVDTKYYLSVWIDRCRDFARLVDHNPVGNIGVSFFLAAVAMGVPYQLGNSTTGDLAAVGLREHGGEKITAAGWKQTLQGNVLAPSVPERRFASPSPSQVFVGGR